MTIAPPITTHALTMDHRERLLRLARDVSFDEGTRILRGPRADQFWVVRTGTVSLDIRVPGRSAAVVETLGHNELIGWSWLFEPFEWQLGAEAFSPVRAHEFDADAVRGLCGSDPVLDAAISRWVGRVLAHRLRPGTAAGHLRSARQRGVALSLRGACRAAEPWRAPQAGGLAMARSWALTRSWRLAHGPEGPPPGGATSCTRCRPLSLVPG